MHPDAKTLRRTVPIVGDALPAGVLLVAAIIAAMEIVLALHGIRATAVDDETTWMLQRERAAKIGGRALLLVGASRIQTSIDIDALHEATGLEPVQLAIDGSLFTPILKELADDLTVTGTIIVSYQATALLDTNGMDIASQYARDFDANRDRVSSIDFRFVEYRLDSLVRSHLRSFADGARPITTLFQRILTSEPTPQYATFLPDRSRLANFANVDIANIYYGRVLRELGGDLTIPHDADATEIDREIRTKIAASPVIPEQAYRAGAETVAGYVRQIQKRGGQVIFVEFPTSGLITEIEDHSCPRVRCWDQFVAITSSPNLNFRDVRFSNPLTVPDGSHIDFRDRRQLTLALVHLLKLDEHPSPNKG